MRNASVAFCCIGQNPSGTFIEITINILTYLLYCGLFDRYTIVSFNLQVRFIEKKLYHMRLLGKLSKQLF